MQPLTRPPDARANYDKLLEFARYVRDNRPNGDTAPAAVRVVDQPPMGLGLQAARDIAKGEIVVWYGGPYVLCSSIAPEHNTHAFSFPDYDEVLTVTSQPMAIDGKMVSAAFNDRELVTDAEREDLLLISGAIVNSSRSFEYEDEMPSMMEYSETLNILRTPPPRHVQFAAKPFLATRDIAEGEPIYWSYHIPTCPMNPTGFESVLPKPPPPPKPKKRAVLLVSPGSSSGGGGGCGCSSKAAKTGADANGLVSLTGLRL